MEYSTYIRTKIYYYILLVYSCLYQPLHAIMKNQRGILAKSNVKAVLLMYKTSHVFYRDNGYMSLSYTTVNIFNIKSTCMTMSSCMEQRSPFVLITFIQGSASHYHQSDQLFMAIGRSHLQTCKSLIIAGVHLKVEIQIQFYTVEISVYKNVHLSEL